MRLKYIDSAKGFCMLLILWGHTISFYEPLFQWGTAFKITLFYIVTGYLLGIRSTQEKLTEKTPVKKLLLSNGVPYVFYSALSLIATAVIMLLFRQPLSFFTEKLLLTVTLAGVSTLWFLPTMFFGRFLYERIFAANPLKVIKLVFLVAAPFVLCFCAEALQNSGDIPLKEVVSSVFNVIIKALVGFWFISVGSVGAKISKKLEEKPVVKYITAIVLLVAGSVLAFMNNNVDFNRVIFGSSPLLFFITGVFCSFGILGIFELLTKKLPCSFTAYIGRNSLFIMVTHHPLYIVTAVSFVTKKLIEADSMFTGYLLAIITLLITLAIEAVLIKVKDLVVAFLEKRLKSEKIKLLIKYI